jgi:hypothetical protein
MNEPGQVQDLRELVGYPGTPLRKFSRVERSAAKKIVQNIPPDIDQVTALRLALSCGSPIQPDWLKAGHIDLALETDDILRNFDRLLTVKKITSAAQVAEVLSRRVVQAPGVVLRALVKLTLPKAGGRGPSERPMLDQDTTLWTITLATALVPLLLERRAPKAKKLVPKTLLGIVSSVLKACPTAEVAVRGLEFLRALERYVGWAEMESEPMEAMRNSVLGLPALIIPGLLEHGALGEATLLSERVKLSESAERLFNAAITDAVATRNELPLISRNWALRLLQPENQQESISPVPSDASYERLALLLINAWEARGEGGNAAHAFTVSQEVLQNGFHIYLVGEVGTSTLFDPDLHESKAQLQRGAPANLIRPWVELKSSNEVRILIKGRVVDAT